MKKYIILPDVHGSPYWKTIKDKIKDHIFVFLGDYCSSHDTELRETEVDNFKEILEFKKQNPDKVVLLLGNHDLNQHIIGENMSRKADPQKMAEIKELFLKNIELFTMVYKVGDYICSHAGISSVWFKYNNFNTWEDINKAFENGKYDCFGYYFGNPFDRTGEDPHNSCTWLRPEALINNLQYPKQIVGHTKINLFPNSFTHEKLPGVEIYFLDKDIINQHHLELEV